MRIPSIPKSLLLKAVIIYLCPEEPELNLFSRKKTMRKLRSSLNFIIPKGCGFTVLCKEINLLQSSGCQQEYLSFQEKIKWGYLGKVCGSKENFSLIRSGNQDKRYKLSVNFKKKSGKNYKGGFKCKVDACTNNSITTTPSTMTTTADPCDFLIQSECFHIGEPSAFDFSAFNTYCFNHFDYSGEVFPPNDHPSLLGDLRTKLAELNLDVWADDGGAQCFSFPHPDDPTAAGITRSCTDVYRPLCYRYT